MSLTLEGAVALVTGASGGIGQAICVALKHAGARVVATDVRNRASGPPVDAWVNHDVTSVNDWLRVIGIVEDQFGQLDCLVNNAGISLIESVAETTLEQWRRVSSVNVESVLLGLQSALPLLRQSGASRGGGSSVVNVSSTAGLRGVAFNAAYSASKGAVTLLTKSAAKEFAILGFPIRVNSIHPGPVDTEMMDAILAQYVKKGLANSKEEQSSLWTAMSPLKRMGCPEEIAGGVVYLCSTTSSYMTGSELVIDGALTA